MSSELISFWACLEGCCLCSCLYQEAEKIFPNHSMWLKIYEIYNPDKYLLFKKKKEIKQLINCHYNIRRQFNST